MRDGDFRFLILALLAAAMFGATLGVPDQFFMAIMAIAGALTAFVTTGRGRGDDDDDERGQVTLTVLGIAVATSAMAMVQAAISDEFDPARALVIGAIMFSSGACLSSMLRFFHAFSADPDRIWLARILLRVCSLGMLYFCLDTTLQHWGDPLRLRSVILFAVLLVFPWALNELTHDIFRTGSSRRRAGDSDDGQSPRE